MQSAIRQAFIASRNQYTADRVVADPLINLTFIAECRRRGLKGKVCDLNRALLDLRKRGLLRTIGKTQKTSFRNECDYRFASEIAVRFLERRDQISLDEIICDPKKAIEFDALAGKIAPGYSPLQYRWAAFNLRKRRRLRPEVIGHALPSLVVTITPVKQLSLDQVSGEAGLYVFVTRTQVLYVGEASNLRIRIKKHLDHSDNKQLARWFWEFGNEEVLLELHVLSANVKARVRRALEAELIISRRPVFNVAGTEA